MEGRCWDVSMFGKVSDVSRRDDLFSREEEEEQEARDERCACENAAMEISREEDKTIRRQDEVIVGEKIELHSSGLSALSSPGLQVRYR